MKGNLRTKATLTAGIIAAMLIMVFSAEQRQVSAAPIPPSAIKWSYISGTRQVNSISPSTTLPLDINQDLFVFASSKDAFSADPNYSKLDMSYYISGICTVNYQSSIYTKADRISISPAYSQVRVNRTDPIPEFALFARNTFYYFKAASLASAIDQPCGIYINEASKRISGTFNPSSLVLSANIEGMPDNNGQRATRTEYITFKYP
jgi:hypothetical protein